MCVLSCIIRVQLSVTPWTAALQAPLSRGFCRQEYWSGLPALPPGYPPHSGIKPESHYVSCIAGGFSTTEPPAKSWADPIGKAG